MGIIIRQIRKRGNQQLAAPLTTTTSLTPEQVVQAVRDFCEAHNRAVAADLARRRSEGGRLKRIVAEGTKAADRQYHVLVRERDVLIGYQRSPQFILANANRKHVGWSAGWWLAAVRFPRTADTPPAGQRVVEVRLANWVMDSDGKVENRSKYEALTDAILEAVSTNA